LPARSAWRGRRGGRIRACDQGGIADAATAIEAMPNPRS
jgi:hypothetical protein